MKESELKNITEQLIETFSIAGKESIEIFKKGLKIEIKEDKSPVSNGDLVVDGLITNKIKELTPNIPIISEETVDLKKKNKFDIFWLIDPIDGTKEYIAGKDEYTLNAALIINKVPCIGLVGAPKKGKLFYSYGADNSYVLEKNKKIKNNCSKKTSKGEIVALSSSTIPSKEITIELKNIM
jgi:3'(2'), 5'-bisphosphate nucleotidase